MKLLISGQFNAFLEGFNAAGVYMASGLMPSNSFEQPIYIGSSNNLKHRIARQHIPQLVLGEHGNKPFQYYASKRGVENIVWFLLESCDAENALLREQYYLDLYTPFCENLRGFNIAKDAAAPLRGRKHTNITRAKMAAAKLGKPGNKHTCHSKALLSKSAKLRSRKLKYKQFQLINPNGTILHFSSVKECYSLYGLIGSEVTRLLRGKILQYRGWTVSEPVFGVN